MQRRLFEKPEVNEYFSKGEIIEWNFREKLTFSHGKYSFRFSITFSDGSTLRKEKWGFKTKKECLEAREITISQLNNHEFVAFRINVKEFYDYWLYYYMSEKLAYQSFVAYRNIIYNYIVPIIGPRYMDSVKRDTLIEVLNTVSDGLLSTAYSVIQGGFKYAKSRNYVSTNVAIAAVKAKREQVNKKNRAERQPRRHRPVLSLQQLYDLLIKCRNDEPDLFLPLLITITTGIRISELLALKFSSVNYLQKELSVTCQLGRKLNDEGIEKGELYKQEIKTKSYAGSRTIALPEFVMDEIIVANERYKAKAASTPDFFDGGYIWHQDNGRPHGRNDYRKAFNRLKISLSLPEDLHWHDLRHCFATVMATYKVNLKELSYMLGHYSDIFSLQNYIDQDAITCIGVPEYDKVIDEVLPNTDIAIYDIEISPEIMAYILPG